MRSIGSVIFVLQIKIMIPSMLLNLSDGTTFDMPDWQDCTWRRVNCQQLSCAMCKREILARQKAIDLGLDPDSMEVALMTAHDSFAEVRELIEKDAERLAIDLDNLDDVEMPDPPKPETYPIYNTLKKWHSDLVDFVSEQSGWGAKWFETEVGKDLLWYKNTLLVKTIRALNGKWESGTGNVDVEPDYLYTRYVIAQCLMILKSAFVELRRDLPDDITLMMLHSRLVEMEAELAQI